MATPKKPVSLADVAALAGVSTATAARVLGGYGTARSKNADAIKAAAKHLGYTPNLTARGMKTGRSRLLALLISDIENQFFSRLTRGVADAAQREGYQLIIANTNENAVLEYETVQALRERQVDGFVIVPTFRSSERLLTVLRESGIPTVLVDRDIPDSGLDAVTVNNRGAAREIVRILIEEGHERIAFVADSPGSIGRSNGNTTTWERRQGYEEAMLKEGFMIRAPYIRTTDHRVSSAHAETISLLELNEPPTAIFTTDINMTLGAITALQERGIVIGRDISIAAFDDPDWARLLSPALTSVNQPSRRMGEAAVERIVLRIREPDLEPAKIMLATDIIFRGSHRALPADT